MLWFILKVDIIIFYNPLQKLRIFTFWLFLGMGGVGGGSHFDEKNHLFKGCGEQTVINRLILELAPEKHLHSIENQILVRIKLKRDTRLQKKLAECNFLETLVKNPAIFNFLAEKGLNV